MNVSYPIPPALRYRALTVGAGTGDVLLWNLDMDALKMFPGFVFQATMFSCSVAANCSICWTVDSIEQTDWVRTSEWDITVSLGSLENPLTLDPGIVIINESKITCTNSDSESHDFWVFVYGGFIKRSVFEKLCEEQC